jgi:hypothetical protein
MGWCAEGQEITENISQAFRLVLGGTRMAGPNENKSNPGKKVTDDSPPSLAEVLAEAALGAGEGAARGTPAGGAILGAVRSVDWEKLIKEIIAGAEAKKDKQFLISFIDTLIQIDLIKDLIIKMLHDKPLSAEDKGLLDKVFEGIVSWWDGPGDDAIKKARKDKAIDELEPRISAIEHIARDIYAKIKNNEFDGAREELLKKLIPMLQELHKWIQINVK